MSWWIFLLGSILRDAWDSKTRGSTSYATTPSVSNGWCLFTDGPHSHPPDFGNDTLQRWWRNQWGIFHNWIVQSVGFLRFVSIGTVLKLGFVLVVFPRMDPANERYVGGKKAWGLGISWQRFQNSNRLLFSGMCYFVVYSIMQYWNPPYWTLLLVDT